MEKKKIIAVIVVVVIVIAIIAFLVTRKEGDDSNGGNGGENQPPTAEITLLQTGFYINQIIYFNSTSFDIDGDEITHLWDFDDGDTSAEANTTHVYTEAGTYNVTLTVTDEHDKSDYDTVTIIVKDIPVVELGVQKYEPPILPPEYTVTITSIIPSIPAELVHFYVIDGTTQDVLVEGNVADYTPPHALGYVYYNDIDADGNLSEDDNFFITDDALSSKGIGDGDIFKLTMEESDDLLGQITLG